MVVNKAMKIIFKFHVQMLCTFCNIQGIQVYPINFSTKFVQNLTKESIYIWIMNQSKKIIQNNFNSHTNKPIISSSQTYNLS